MTRETSSNMNAALELLDVRKSFGKSEIIRGANLSVSTLR